MQFENFKNFLDSIDNDLGIIFDNQKEYLCCKEGCTLCCEQGDYPLSRLEFNYLMYGFNQLEGNKKEQIKKNYELIKDGNKDSYRCPFLINKACSLYDFRPFVCRAFGVLTNDAQGNPSYPFCTEEGLNYSRIYDKEKQHLSMELVLKNGYKVLPQFFNLSNSTLMNLPEIKDYGIEFGEAKKMIDFLEEIF